MKQEEIEETEHDLCELLQEGMIKAAWKDGRVVYYHIANVPLHPNLHWLTVQGVAELDGWDWFFLQN